ncbi:MAG: DUF456 domain-containing protein [Ekhidna sp.]|nr:DUF456 domain-containing protein [Ekhidna sp.]
MEALLVVLSVLLIAGGIIFSILPPLPGPLLTYGALICTHNIANGTEFSTTSLVVWGAIGVAVIFTDYLLPIAATKKFGGTRAGVIGGMIGTILGIILPIPMGIILGPLLGAIIGDLYGGNRIKAAFKSGFGSFLGFVTATGLKLLYAVILGGVIAWEVGGFTISRMNEWL